MSKVTARQEDCTVSYRNVPVSLPAMACFCVHDHVLSPRSALSLIAPSWRTPPHVRMGARTSRPPPYRPSGFLARLEKTVVRGGIDRPIKFSNRASILHFNMRLENMSHQPSWLSVHAITTPCEFSRLISDRMPSTREASRREHYSTWHVCESCVRGRERVTSS